MKYFIKASRRNIEINEYIIEYITERNFFKYNLDYTPNRENNRDN